MLRQAHKAVYYVVIISSIIAVVLCNSQTGPDPWNYEDKELLKKFHDNDNVPPDLKLYPKKKTAPKDVTLGAGEWFYRRLLSIVLKGGEVNHEDGIIDISIQMKLDKQQWDTLEDYLKTNTPLTEDMLRRSLGYIEQSIYEPSLPTKIILAWSDYIQLQFMEYKTEITWVLALLAAAGFAFWIWTRMSRKHALVLIFITLYSYEVFVSYKEAEQKEVDRFMGALNRCKWYIWSSTCDVPKPDPLIFLKHMNPLKILVRMFTTIISEPMITLSDTIKIMAHGITDGMWPPFNVLFYSILVTFFNVLLFLFLIMIICNYVFNIPFNFSALGLIGISMQQRKATEGASNHTEPLHIRNENPHPRNPNNIDDNMLGRILDVVQQAINVGNNRVQNPVVREADRPRSLTNIPNTGLKRSSSTGRLPNSTSFEFDGELRRRKQRIDGAGDAR